MEVVKEHFLKMWNWEKSKVQTELCFHDANSICSQRIFKNKYLKSFTLMLFLSFRAGKFLALMFGIGWWSQVTVRTASFPLAMPSSGAQCKHLFAHTIISFVDKIDQLGNLCPCVYLNGTGNHLAHKKNIYFFKAINVSTHYNVSFGDFYF